MPLDVGVSTKRHLPAVGDNSWTLILFVLVLDLIIRSKKRETITLNNDDICHQDSVSEKAVTIIWLNLIFSLDFI